MCLYSVDFGPEWDSRNSRCGSEMSFERLQKNRWKWNKIFIFSFEGKRKGVGDKNYTGMKEKGKLGLKLLVLKKIVMGVKKSCIC